MKLIKRIETFVAACERPHHTESGAHVMERFMTLIRWGGLVCGVVMIAAWIASRYWYVGIGCWGSYYVETVDGGIDFGVFRYVGDREHAYETEIVIETISDTRFLRRVSHRHKMRRIAWVPYWLLVMALGGLAAYLFWRARRRTPSGHCRTCGYDLTGNLSGVCPECGNVIRDRTPEKVETPQAPEARKKLMDNRQIVKWALIYAVITVPLSIILRGMFQCITRP